MQTVTEYRDELLTWMIEEAGISYWSSGTSIDGDEITVTESNYEYDVPPEDHTFTRAQFLTAVRKFAADHKDNWDEYTRRFSRDVLRSNWEAVDYDSVIADRCVQQAALGGVVYG